MRGSSDVNVQYSTRAECVWIRYVSPGGISACSLRITGTSLGM